MTTDWSIQEIARLAGTTSRTLRHYDEIGLLRPTRIGSNGYRYYDTAALVRLQRILLLRDLGLGLPAIGGVLAGEESETAALAGHLAWLRQERERLARQIASVEKTMHARQEGAPIMAQEMFDGFDHTHHREEVEERWGADAYASGDRWWRGMSADERTAWQARSAELRRDWRAAAQAGVAPDGAAALALAERHVAWLRSIPGTPAAAPGGDLAAYLTGLGEMYVADERFAENYGGQAGAGFVRDALHAYVEAHLAR